jgi:hypothetical protein
VATFLDCLQRSVLQVAVPASDTQVLDAPALLDVLDDGEEDQLDVCRKM